MFSETDYDKLKMIMEESPEKKELLSRLLTSHQMTISTMSHEIRNPLTLLYSTMQLMESHYTQIVDFNYWSELRNDIEYMKLLLEELSVYNNGNRLSISQINTNTFFKTLVISFASALIHTDIQFISKIAPNLPLIQGDPVKLRQVFLNLFENARDAVCSSSHLNDKNRMISFSVCYSRQELLITIHDNGCGIPSEDINTIFEPFVTYKKNGTGLGLAIASRIIKAHHGTLKAVSVPGIGTTFTLTLPVEKHS